ncbi:hypothetical protein FFLO_05520 [Filobasidium floriforme]|uniref:Uncharacterized protein n=1 Tax=Filobasidium floriforme TaxID=5210 RepID=A0A8K0JGQ5_9TREE|nr:uncharacterized protein HD553DRAFT_338694 [Filobasidium floriforme]KAG7529642.1 hypothetical protein FFLO_05520 [Filobasidium floriforme]KAH8090980.1 hypothetical protein HD553DRAFT_338694 [Filobasidium floriforme]
MSWFKIRPNSGLSLPLETAILWCGGGPECPICHIVHPAEENARRHSEEHMPPEEEIEMRRRWHLGELVAPLVKRSMVTETVQASRRVKCTDRELSLNSGFYPGWKQDSELPFPSVSKIRKAVDPSLPPAVAPPVIESAEEKRLKEKVSQRDTEIDRLRKEVTSLQDQLRNEVTSLQDQMAGQHQAFQAAIGTIRQDASMREQELKEELAVEMQEHLDKIPRLEARLRANDIVNNRLVLALALKMQDNIAQINALHDIHAVRIVQIGLGYTQTLANITAEHANALATIIAEHADALAALNEELTHREVLHGEREQAHIEQMIEAAEHVQSLVLRLQQLEQDLGNTRDATIKALRGQVKKRDEEIEGLHRLVAAKKQQVNVVKAQIKTADQLVDQIKGAMAVPPTLEEIKKTILEAVPAAPTLQQITNILPPPPPTLQQITNILPSPAPKLEEIKKTIVEAVPAAPTLQQITNILPPPAPKLDEIKTMIVEAVPAAPKLEDIKTMILAEIGTAVKKVLPNPPTADDIANAVPTVDAIVEKVSPAVVQEIKKVLPSVPTVESIVQEIKKVLPVVPTVESIVQEVKKVLPSVPTVDSIVQEVKKVLPSVPTVDSIVQEVKKVLPAGPTAEDIGKAVKIPTAEDIGRAVKVEVPTAEAIGKAVKMPTAEDIGRAVKVEVPTAEAIGKQVKVEVPTAEAIGKQVKVEVPTAEAIGKQVKVEVPTAEAIGKQVKVEVPTAEDIGKQVKVEVPTAEDIGKQVKVEVPTADEIGRAVKVDVPTAEAIGKAVKVDVPTADNIGQAIKLPAAEEIGKAVKCNPQFKFILPPQMIKDLATQVGEIISAKVISSFADKVISSGSGVSRDLDEDELQQAIDDLSTESVPANDIAQAVLEQRFMDGYKDWKGAKERPSLFFVALAQCVQRRHYPGSVFKASLGVAERIVEEGYDMVGEQDPRAAAAFVALCSVIRKARTG